MNTVLYKIFFPVVVCFALACNNAPQNNTDTEEETTQEIIKKPAGPVFASYREAIEAYRKKKDMNLLANEIIEPEKRNIFKGLKYFEPDTGFIFNATLDLLKPERIILKTTDERAPEYYKFCKLGFKKDGTDLVLIGYVDNIESPESIFIPFKDATGNKTTYGGGRYIDLHYNGERTMITLDFNYAYNPYCHYNHNYSCPLVTKENVLSIPIFAGEKKLYE